MTAPARSCGSCTLCCKVMAVAKLDKPAGRWCVHIAQGRGCAAYEARPSSCRDFSCGWLMQPGIPEALRPDRSKVILQLENAKRLIARCDQSDPAAWRREPMYSILKTWAGRTWPSGHQMLAAVGEHYWAITPTRAQPDIDLGVLALDTPFEVDVMSDGRLIARVAGKTA